MLEVRKHQQAIQKGVSAFVALRQSEVQQTLDQLCDQTEDTEVLKLAYLADAQISAAIEAIRTLNFCLTLREKHTPEVDEHETLCVGA